MDDFARSKTNRITLLFYLALTFLFVCAFNSCSQKQEKINDFNKKREKEFNSSLGCSVCLDLESASKSKQNEIYLIINDEQYFELPESITKLTNIVSLIILDQRHLNWKDAFIKISQLPSLKKLEFEYYGKEIIPKEINMLVNLEELTINFKNKGSVNFDTTLCNLKELFIFGGLSAAPGGLEFLKELKVLTLSGTNLKKVPLGICSLEKLKVLNLSKNPISTIPSQFNNLKSLENLSLWDTPFGEKEKEYYIQNGQYYFLEELHYLLPNCKIILEYTPSGLIFGNAPKAFVK